MATGEIYLYDAEGTEIKHRQYDSVEHRRSLISFWQKTVGIKKIARMHIHVCPKVRIDLVSDNGKNIEGRGRHIVKEKEGTIIKEDRPFVRPPAEYNNIKTYEYK